MKMYCNQLIVDVDVNAESSSRTRNQSNAAVNEYDYLYMDGKSAWSITDKKLISLVDVLVGEIKVVAPYTS